MRNAPSPQLSYLIGGSTVPDKPAPKQIGHCGGWLRPSIRGAGEDLKIIDGSGCSSKVWENFFLIGWKQHLLRGEF